MYTLTPPLKMVCIYMIVGEVMIFITNRFFLFGSCLVIFIFVAALSLFLSPVQFHY